MITCTPERSGIASSGVRNAEKMPQAVNDAVAISTSSRLATDQRIRRSIMVTSQNLHLFDHILAGFRLAAHLELHPRAWPCAMERVGVTELERHGHGRPLQTWNGLMGQQDGPLVHVVLLHDAYILMQRWSVLLGVSLRLARRFDHLNLIDNVVASFGRGLNPEA